MQNAEHRKDSTLKKMNFCWLVEYCNGGAFRINGNESILSISNKYCNVKNSKGLKKQQKIKNFTYFVKLELFQIRLKVFFFII